MFIEYPKALYRMGELTTVQDASEEAAARKEGYTDWHSDQDAISAAAAAPAATSKKKA